MKKFKEGDEVVVFKGDPELELVTFIDHIDGDKIWFLDEQGQEWYEFEDAIEKL